MQNIALVIGECHAILFAFILSLVKRWKGEMVKRFPRNKSSKLYTVSSRPVGVLAKARSGLVG